MPNIVEIEEACHSTSNANTLSPSGESLAFTNSPSKRIQRRPVITARNQNIQIVKDVRSVQWYSPQTGQADTQVTVRK